MRPLAAFLLAVLASGARAGVISFDAGPDSGAIFSADGYHVARLVNQGRWDAWLVDGRVRARAKAGTLPGGGVLSADGSRLLHLVAAADAEGRVGVALAINGRRAGRPFREIRSLALSPGGRNAAGVVKTPGGWAVSSAQGVGPSFPEPPFGLTVADNGVLYFAKWQGTVWLYRDHKPLRSMPGTEVSASADLKRVGAVARDRAAGTAYVEVDGVRYGPYADASVPVFSRGGRHWAAMTTALGSQPGGYDAILADGRPEAGTQCSNCSLVVDDAGRAFQDLLLVSVGDEAQEHSFYLNGRQLREGGRPPRVGLLAGGAHYVYPMLTPRGIGVGFDGRELEWGVPLPLPNAPVEFDGPREYHYWSFEHSSLRLVCGTVDGSDPKLSRCASRVRGVFPPAAD